MENNLAVLFRQLMDDFLPDCADWSVRLVDKDVQLVVHINDVQVIGKTSDVMEVLDQYLDAHPELYQD